MSTLRFQSVRFVLVGLASNAVLYLLYIFLTGMGLHPTIAVSIVFLTGVIQTFVFNKNWTFANYENSRPQLIRYLLVYFFAYMLNILMLYILVEKMNFPHRWVQAVAVIVIGMLLFLGQRYWVFTVGRKQKSSTPQ